MLPARASTDVDLSMPCGAVHRHAGRPAVVDGLLQGIQHETGIGGAADPPANGMTGVDIDHEGYIRKPGAGRYIGKSEIHSRLGAGAWKWRLT